MKEKRVSLPVSSLTYAVLKHHASLDERSVRAWFERYVRTAFAETIKHIEHKHNSPLTPALNTTLNPALNPHQVNHQVNINPIIEPTLNETQSLKATLVDDWDNLDED